MVNVSESGTSQMQTVIKGNITVRYKYKVNAQESAEAWMNMLMSYRREGEGKIAPDFSWSLTPQYVACWAKAAFGGKTDSWYLSEAMMNHVGSMHFLLNVKKKFYLPPVLWFSSVCYLMVTEQSIQQLSAEGNSNKQYINIPFIKLWGRQRKCWNPQTQIC